MTPTTDPGRLVRDSDTLLPELVPPSLPRPGVCPICRTWNDTDGAVCSNCAFVHTVLGRPALPLAVATLYAKPSRLRNTLTGYKQHDPAGPPDVLAAARVRALAGRFLLEHGTALAAGPVDGIVVVPSTDRSPPHPLAGLLATLGLAAPVLPWLVRGTGPIGHDKPHPDAFAPAADLRPGTRVVLADDVYTTGARANSAAHALRAAGVRVAVLAVLARRVNPDHNDASRAFWDHQSQIDFTWAASPVVAG